MRNPLHTLTALLLLPLAAHAQTAPAPALPGSRTLKSFDFEETKLGNFESTPMFWPQVTGPGFPAYSKGAFDRTVHRSGETSFKLETRGGSVAYRYVPPADAPSGRIPIAPNSDYYILAFVKTAQLKNARPDLTAWFADDSGNLLLNTEKHSQPYQPADAKEAPPAPDTWQVLYIHLPGPIDTPDSPTKVRSLVLQMGIMQPQQLPADQNPLGRFAIYQQDLQGAAWFDDIVIFQLPRVSISVPPTEHTIANNIFGTGDDVQLDLLVSDLRKPTSPNAQPPNPLRARLRITNPDGIVFANQEFPAQPTPEKAWSFRYNRPSLPAGLYTATLDLFDPSPTQNTTPIARRQTQFLCLPANSPTRPAPAEFTLSATSLTDPASWADLPALAKQLHAGTLQLPIWRRDLPEDAMTKRDQPLDSLLATLQRQNTRIIGTFSELPAFLANRITTNPDPDQRNTIFALTAADPKLWQPLMAYPLTRYANRIELWQIGDPTKPFSGDLQPASTSIADVAPTLYNRTFKEISTLLPTPNLVIPWNALYDFDAAHYPNAILDLTLPNMIKPSQLPIYLQNFSVNKKILAHLEPLPPNTPRSERLADFAQRLVYTRAAGPDRILYDLHHDAPDELLLVYRTMARSLGTSLSATELPLSTPQTPVHAFLFRKPADSGAALVLWTDTDDTTLTLPLGTKPTATDILGNASPTALTTDPQTHLSTLRLTTMPLIIENVDPMPLLLSASFSLANRTLPAGAGSITTDLLLTNPYNEILTGTLRVLPPNAPNSSSWSIEPSSIPVNLGPGASLKHPITIRYPFSAPAGTTPLAARLNFENGSRSALDHLDLNTSVTVSSEMIQMEAFTFLQENGDIVIQQIITNISNASIDAQSYATVPGFQRQTRYITDLDPKQTIIKRYTFPANTFTPVPGTPTPQSLQGKNATLGIRQSNGQTLLTKSITFE